MSNLYSKLYFTVLLLFFFLDKEERKSEDKKMLLRFRPAPSSPFCPPARSLQANYIWFRNFELLIKSALTN